ncbi:hypothetical protein RhiXN_10118 [Rhizoctonia solani]|uniref:Uncharacterized protein n=2 Tax=Rhizoctonia solani TaxID=456999 RepID=A0A8H8P1H3_9AGAM|nr:uncharacterized protein RhiXN_10118 [Rhizoctonia solani]QRW23794.1 hypothetical protein RhiXN_10118 [Rhizoctonia solani]
MALSSDILALSTSFPSKQKRALMEFTNTWGDGKVFDLYRTLDRSATSVSRLEIRIEGSAPPHRFVLAYLTNGPTYRFDRRPETSKPGTLALETFAGLSNRKAADDYSILNLEDVEALKGTTHCELDLSAPPNTDLLHVFSACFSLSQDKKAREYALLKYNCYFFSWTLVMIVARHTLPFVVPSSDEVVERATPNLHSLTDSLTDKIVDILLNLVLNTISEFRARLGRSIIGGLRKRGVIVWSLPVGAVRFVLRRALKYQLDSGLRSKLKQKTQEQLVSSLKPMLEELLGQRDTAQTIIEVDKRLWIDELVDDFRPLVGQQLTRVLWDVILNIISPPANVTSTEINEQTQTSTERPEFSVRIKRGLIGDFQFVKMWNDALSAALPAAREAARGKADPSKFQDSQQLHSEMFNTAFKAASGAALEAAQKVAEDTKEEMNNPKRDDMWKKFWKVWDIVWDSSRSKAEATVVQVVNNAAEDIVKVVAKSLVEVVGNNNKQHFMALISEHRSQVPEARRLSIADFQNNILKSVRTAYIQTSEPYVASIQAAMGRAWDISKTTYRPFGPQQQSE